MCIRDRYTSDVLGSGYEDKAFAYFISDEIFGDLEKSSIRKPEKLKACLLYTSRCV